MSEQIVSKVAPVAVATTVSVPVAPKYGVGKCQICGKPLSATSNDIGTTCSSHVGKLRQHALIQDTVPQGWIRMSVVCRKANEQGITTSALVNAAGGDACVKPLLNKVFEVVYVKSGKWMSPDVLTVGFAMLKNPDPKPAVAPKAAKVDEAVTATSSALKQVVKGK